MIELTLVQFFLLITFVSSWIVLLFEVFHFSALHRKITIALGVVWVVSFVGLVLGLLFN